MPGLSPSRPWLRGGRAALVAASVLLGTTLACTGGGGDTEAPEVEHAAPEVVSAHTKGAISTRDPISVVFRNDAVAADQIQSEAEGLLTFHPAVEGKAVWETPRKLVFTPSEPLPQATEFTVEVAASQLNEGWSDFGFAFETVPQTLTLIREGLTAASDDGKQQTFKGSLSFADVADDAAVEKALTATHPGSTLKVSWSHAGRTHRFTIDGIVRKEADSELSLAIDGGALGLESSSDEAVRVPGTATFVATEATAMGGDQRYVEIRFSDPVDDKQDLSTLITVQGHSDLRYELEGSTVRVYDADGWSGVATVSVRDVKNKAGVVQKQAFTQEVSFDPLKPAARFVGKGTVLPRSAGLVLPVEVVNLEAVTVTAHQILGDNIPQFLQDNQLDGDRNLERVGRPVWRKRVPITTGKANAWSRMGLDLSQLVDEFPGGMYRLELRFTKADIDWDCDGPMPEAIPLPPLETDWERHDVDASYWGLFDDMGVPSWQLYDHREDPCSAGYYRKYYDHDIRAGRNVLISDLGLMAKLGEDDRLVAVTTDIGSALPRTGVQVQVLDYQQQVIAESTTNTEGVAVFAGLPRKPFVVQAEEGEDAAWLKLDKGSANALGHFDVGGSSVVDGLKGAFFTERGVWRPGDDVHLTFVLMDTEGTLPGDHPVHFEVMDPNGQLVERRVVTDHVDRFYSLTTSTSADAPTGTYTARVRVGGRTFTRPLRIETVVPNRLKIDLDYGTDRIKGPDAKLAATLKSRWLHGAPAPGLRTTVEMRLKPTKTTFPGYGDYSFDNPSGRFESESVTVFEGTLDENSQVAIDEPLRVDDGAPGMLKATFTTRVFEPGGAASIDEGSVELSPYERYVGIRTPPGDKARGMLLTDKPHEVQIVAVDADGKPKGSGAVEVSLYKVGWRWWWEAGEDNLADYVARGSRQALQTDTVQLKDGKASWSLQIDYPSWGRYLILARDTKGGHVAGKTVFIDWPGWAGRAQADNPGGATVLSVTTADKEVEVGEEVRLEIPTSKGGRAMVSLETGSRVLKTEWVEPQGDTTAYTFKATPDMAPSVYAHVTLIQPHAEVGNDLPVRLYGVVPIEVVDPNTKLEPTITTADTLEPEATARIQVAEAKGQPMTYTLAVVDEGLLGLTRFRTPDLWGAFYQREALGVRTWDVFGSVAGAFGGALEGLIAIGGDGEADAAPPAKANRFPPVVEVLGPFQLAAGAKATHDVELPPYIGEVRVMVVAGHDGAFGSAEKSVPVTKPLLLLATLPRVLGPQETLELPVSVFATDESVKNVTLTVEADGPVLVDAEPQKLRFDRPGDKMVTFPVKVDDAVGIARVKVVAEGSGQKVEQTIEIDVRHPGSVEQRGMSRTIEPGQSWTADVVLFGLKGTNEALVEVSSVPPLDLSRRLDALIRYPHGCVEQTTSSVFPQVYLTQLMTLPDDQASQVQKNVQAGITRLRRFQVPGGGFAYWPGGGGANDWASNYAGHFLVEADRAGYLVPADMLRKWKDHQAKEANRWSPLGGNSLDQAYRLYTLALAGRPELGAMNRLKSTKNLDNEVLWRLAATYELAGQSDTAKALVAKAGVDPARTRRELSGTFGSKLRNQAMIVEALALLEPGSDRTRKAAEAVSEEVASQRWMSTQETAYSLVALARFATVGGSGTSWSWSVDGGPKSERSSDKPLDREALPVQEGTPILEVANTGSGPLYARVVTRGLPPVGASVASAKGLKIEVDHQQVMPYANLDVSRLDQGTDFLVKVKVTNTSGRKLSELALTQVMPSGWEIHGTRPGPGPGYAYRDVRDDRVMTYFDLDKNESRTFTVGLNASYKGHYYLAPVRVEAMYDAELHAQTAGQWVDIASDDGEG